MDEIVIELRIKCGWCSPCVACTNLMERAASRIEALQKRNAHLAAKIAEVVNIAIDEDEAEDGE